MTNAPSTRKTHVIRILGTNKNGDVLSDIWADLERIDQAATVFQSNASNWQGSVRRLKWLDDPEADDFREDGAPSRKSKIVKVCSPDEADQSDPQEWIPVPVIDKMRSSIGDQNEVRSYINAESSHARIVSQRRILHYDTNIDADAQAAFDADPTRKVYVVPAAQYTRDDATKDDSQWLEHEVVTFLKSRINNQTGGGQGDDQGKQTKLLNQYLIDESEDAKLDVVGDDGVNPPWRLDPYQNIINVQLGGATEFPDPSLFEQNDIAIVDSHVVSLSMAVQLRDADIEKGFSLLVLGDPSPARGGGTGLTLSIFKSFEEVLLLVGLGGIYGAMSLPPNVVGITGTPSAFYTDNITPYTPLGQIVSPDISAQVRGDKVFHLGLSIDTSIASAATNGGRFDSGPKIECLINGVPIAMSSAPVPVGGFPSDRVWAFALPDDGATLPSVVDPEIVDPTGLGIDTWRVVIPAFKMAFNGFTVALPIDSTDAGGLGVVTLDKVQIWTSQYIGMRANIDKFLDGNGNILSTSVAQADTAFGKSEFLFEGPPSRFANNRGSANGEMTKLGNPKRAKSLTKVG